MDDNQKTLRRLVKAEEHQTANTLVSGVLALIRLYRESGFHELPNRHELLSRALEGQVMDTYQTAAFQMLGVLSLIPSQFIHELPEFGVIPQELNHEKMG